MEESKKDHVRLLYRVYRVPEENETVEKLNIGIYESFSKDYNELIDENILICSDREHFKEIIRDMYGTDVKFANSKKYKPNTIYCIIIGEVWDDKKYLQKIEFECGECGHKVTTYSQRPYTIDGYTFNRRLCGLEEHSKKMFCSQSCMSKYTERESAKLINEVDGQNLWVSKDSFVEETFGVVGFIYKITKKSTNEFYVGQTVYVPVFRWGQHLKTDRFPIKDITDYKFEIIEKVPNGVSLNERERYWIQKLYRENPGLSLNISLTSKDALQENLFDVIDN